MGLGMGENAHIPNCGTDRESKSVVVADGVFCDPCIAPLVEALNNAGIKTIASCCGHGHRPGAITLIDGRELVIARDWAEARRIGDLFRTDINGNAVEELRSVPPYNELVRAWSALNEADRADADAVGLTGEKWAGRVVALVDVGSFGGDRR